MSAWTYCLQDGKAAPKIVPPRSRIPCWKGLGADSEEKHEPASDIDTVVMDSLKALDPNRPIREADMPSSSRIALIYFGSTSPVQRRLEIGE
jgi:hypothetical protein